MESILDQVWITNYISTYFSCNVTFPWHNATKQCCGLHLYITRTAGHTVKYMSLHLYKTSSVQIVKSCLFMLNAKYNFAVLTITNYLFLPFRVITISRLILSGMAAAWTSATWWQIYEFLIGGCAIKVASSWNCVHTCLKIYRRYMKEWVSWTTCQ